MGQQVYNNRYMKIYKSKNGYIVHNSRKPFEEGHTHINKFTTAKYITKLVIKSEVPEHLSNYLIESLIRLSGDKKYKNKLKQMQTDNFDKASKYITN